MSPADCDKFDKELAAKGSVEIAVDGQKLTIGKGMAEVKRYEKTVHVEEIVPSVIEPSFGIGRIMYAVLEHSFRQREGDEMRQYLSLPPIVAPLKCSVLPLSGNEKFAEILQSISEGLRAVDVSHKIDDSGASIGKRYARTDEVAIPYGITVDFDSLVAPHTATLRERDSMEQVRVPVAEIPGVISRLCSGRMDWEEVKIEYPMFEEQKATLSE